MQPPNLEDGLDLRGGEGGQLLGDALNTNVFQPGVVHRVKVRPRHQVHQFSHFYLRRPHVSGIEIVEEPKEQLREDARTMSTSAFSSDTSGIVVSSLSLSFIPASNILRK